MASVSGHAAAGGHAPATGHEDFMPSGLASISDVAANPVTEEAVFIGTIALVLFLQYITHRLDGVTRRHKHISDMINMMYRELMILGLVAFLLFAITAAGVHVAKEDKIVFEVIHHGLFIVVVIYAASVVTLAMLSLVTSHHWNRYERLDFEQWVECRDEFNSLRHRLDRMAPAQRLCNPGLILRYWTLIEVVRFHDLRYHFLHAHSLATHFRFATYLKKCKQHVFLELTEIHDRVWALLAGVLVVDLYLRGLIPSYAAVADPTPMLILISVVAVIVCFAVYRHITSVYFAILHDESTEFDASLAVTPDQADNDPPGAPEPRATAATGAGRAAHKRALSLQRPKLLLSLLQLALFALCLASALAISFHPRVQASPYGPALAIVLPVCFFLVVLVVARTTPRFTIALHAGDHVDAVVLERTIEKQQQARKRELEQEHATRRRIRRQVRRLRRRARAQMQQYNAAPSGKPQYGAFRSKAASEMEDELLDAKAGHDSDTTVSSDGEMDDGEWVMHTCCPRALRRWVHLRWAQCGGGHDAVPPAEALIGEASCGSRNPLPPGATRSGSDGGLPYGGVLSGTGANEEEKEAGPRSASASSSAFRVHGSGSEGDEEVEEEEEEEGADPEPNGGARPVTWDPPASPSGPRPRLTLERLASRNVATDDLVEELYSRGKQSGNWRQHLVVAQESPPAAALPSSAAADEGAGAIADASDVREVVRRESRMQERRADRKRRDRAEQFSRSKRFVVALMVMLDMFAVALRQFPAAEASAGDLLYAVECVVAAAFLLELAAEVTLHGPREFPRDPWRVVDGVVIVSVAVITFASPSFVAAHALVALRLLRSIIMVGLLSLPFGSGAKGHDPAEPAEEAGHSTAGSESESADDEADDDNEEDEDSGDEGEDGEKEGVDDGESSRDEEVAWMGRAREHRGGLAVLGHGASHLSQLPSAAGAHSQIVRVQSHNEALSAAGHRRAASSDTRQAGPTVAADGTGQAGEGAGTTSRHSLSRSSLTSHEPAPRLGLPAHLDTAGGTYEPSPTPWDAPTPSTNVAGGTGPAPSPTGTGHTGGHTGRSRAQTQKRLSMSLRRLVPSEPVELTGDTFEDRVLNASLPWVVMFYTPWCRQCAKLWPKWPDIARRLRKHGVCAGQAHAEKHEALADLCGVEHYPSILVFTAGAKTLEASVHYSGPLHRADILDFVLETVHYDRTSALHHGRRPTLAMAAAAEAEGAAAAATAAHYMSLQRSQSLVSLQSRAPRQSPHSMHGHDSGEEDGQSTESLRTAAPPRIRVGVRIPTDSVPTVRVLPARESALRFRRKSQNLGGSRSAADDGAAQSEGDRLVSTERIFRGKLVVLVGVPGAFSPESTATHLPGFLAHRDSLREAGVKEVVCVTVNDPSVTGAWAEATGTRDFVTFVSDWDGAFTHAMGMLADLSHINLGLRSRRYAAVLDDGIVRDLLLEDGGAEEEPVKNSHAAQVLKLL